jgi:flagellar basal-body rod protein FlgG
MKWAVDAKGQPVGTITLGPKIGLSQLDLTPGPIQETSNPLDLAIAGNGFFAVQAPDGTTRYTRDGGFHADIDGSLRSRDGSTVLDTNSQPIQLPLGTDIAVAADGTVLAGGNTVAQLQLVDFPAGQQLDKVGNGMFTAANGAQAQPTNGVQLYQGYLEGSNTDMTESMVSTMNLVRAYEANQKLLQMQDSTLRSAVNEVGKA